MIKSKMNYHFCLILLTKVNQQLQLVVNRMNESEVNGDGPKKNLLKTNYLNGEREEMLEKNKTPISLHLHLNPQPIWNRVQYSKTVMGGHPS